MATLKGSGFHYLYGVGNLENNFGKIVNKLRTKAGYSETHVQIKRGTNYYVKGYFNIQTNKYVYQETGMFRQDWTIAETLDNIALAYATKVYDEGNMYFGNMSDTLN